MADLLMWMGILGIVVGLPWLLLHYITKWKQAPSLTGEDEKLLDDLHYTARRLEDRLATIERIIAADHPDWKPLDTPAQERRLEDYDVVRRNCDVRPPQPILSQQASQIGRTLWRETRC